VTSLTQLVLAAASPSPTPSPTPSGIDPNLVTPGWVGFAFTAAIVIVVIVLIVDMVRRMRRVRYREEARQRIAAELDAAVDGTEPPAAGPADDDAPEDDASQGPRPA